MQVGIGMRRTEIECCDADFVEIHEQAMNTRKVTILANVLRMPRYAKEHEIVERAVSTILRQLSSAVYCSDSMVRVSAGD